MYSINTTTRLFLAILCLQPLFSWAARSQKEQVESTSSSEGLYRGDYNTQQIWSLSPVTFGHSYQTQPTVHYESAPTQVETTNDEDIFPASRLERYSYSDAPYGFPADLFDGPHSTRSNSHSVAATVEPLGNERYDIHQSAPVGPAPLHLSYPSDPTVQSTSLPIQLDPKTTGKRRKTPRHFLPEEVQRLESVFKTNQYPDRIVINGLVKELGITYERIRSWFEYRRRKARKNSKGPACLSGQRRTAAGSSENEDCTIQQLAPVDPVSLDRSRPAHVRMSRKNASAPVEPEKDESPLCPSSPLERPQVVLEGPLPNYILKYTQPASLCDEPVNAHLDPYPTASADPLANQDYDVKQVSSFRPTPPNFCFIRSAVQCEDHATQLEASDASVSGQDRRSRSPSSPIRRLHPVSGKEALQNIGMPSGPSNTCANGEPTPELPRNEDHTTQQCESWHRVQFEPSPIYDKGTPAYVEHNKVTRLRFSHAQVERLEAVFRQTQHPVRVLHQSLAEELGTTLKRVQTWFQNRRARPKNDD